MAKTKFSDDLTLWLSSDGDKTLGQLQDRFGTKGFAVALLLLMILPALPLPTGGVTHVFEVITALLALELLVGRRTIWLPKWAEKRKLGNLTTAKVLPKLAKFIGWFERYSRPRWESIMINPVFVRLLGILVLVFTTAAFLAPPFSGLDTLPALAVVLLAITLLLEDAILLIGAIIAGCLGIGLELVLGATIVHFLRFY